MEGVTYAIGILGSGLALTVGYVMIKQAANAPAPRVKKLPKPSTKGQKEKPAPVKQVDNGPNEAKRRKRAAAAKAKASAEAAAKDAAAATVRKELAAQQKATKLATAEALMKKDAYDAEAKARKSAVAAQAKAELKSLETRRKENKAAEDKAAKTAEAKKKAAAANVEKLAKEEKVNAKKREAKKEALRAGAAARKQAIADSKKREEERLEAIAGEEARLAAIQAEEDKKEAALEALKREKSANWEESGKKAVAERQKKLDVKLARKTAKQAKNQARADEKQAFEQEIEAGVEALKNGGGSYDVAEDDDDEDDDEDVDGEDDEDADEDADEDDEDADEGEADEATEDAAEDDAEDVADDAAEAVEEPADDLAEKIGEAEDESNAIKVDAEAIKERVDAAKAKVDGLETAEAPAAAAAKPVAKPVVAAAPWDSEAWRAEPKKMPKTVPEAYCTYSDDSALGKDAPALDSLVYIKDGPVAYSSEIPTVIVFWAKFAKGDYTSIVGVSEICDDFKEQAQFVGISVDPNVDDAKSFLKKMGTAMPELDVKKMLANYPLAWDVDKTVKNAFMEACGLMTLGASATFIVDKKGKVLWREQFGQGYAPKKGQLREQLRRHCGGEGMLSNGKKPVDEESDEDLAEGAEMDCDYDSDLGF